MRSIARWAGWIFSVAGGVLIAAHFLAIQRGLEPSINVGDPAKFEFVLVPFWQIGLAVTAIGIALLIVSRLHRIASAKS